MWLIWNVVVCSRAGRGIQLECSRKIIWISIGADSSRLFAVGVSVSVSLLAAVCTWCIHHLMCVVSRVVCWCAWC